MRHVSGTARWGAAITVQVELHNTALRNVVHSFFQHLSTHLLRRKQLSIHTTIIPICSKSSDRAAWLIGYFIHVATTGLNKLSRQLGVKRLGCQDIRSSKHNYSVGKTRSFVAVPTHTKRSHFGNGMAPFPKGVAPPEWWLPMRRVF